MIFSIGFKEQVFYNPGLKAPGFLFANNLQILDWKRYLC